MRMPCAFLCWAASEATAKFAAVEPCWVFSAGVASCCSLLAVVGSAVATSVGFSLLLLELESELQLLLFVRALAPGSAAAACTPCAGLTGSGLPVLVPAAFVPDTLPAQDQTDLGVSA